MMGFMNKYEYLSSYLLVTPQNINVHTYMQFFKKLHVHTCSFSNLCPAAFAQKDPLPDRCSAASVCPASVARQATLFADGLARADHRS